jgi:uncharacterized Zn-binding protein involved in type VI secretion
MAGMPQARVGDISMGHWIGPFFFPPVPLVTGSPRTRSDGLPCCRVSDQAAPHFGLLFGVVPVPATLHTPIAMTGATRTTIDGMPAFRVGDLYTCGDIHAIGSPRDFAL